MSLKILPGSSERSLLVANVKKDENAEKKKQTF